MFSTETFRIFDGVAAEYDEFRLPTPQWRLSYRMIIARKVVGV